MRWFHFGLGMTCFGCWIDGFEGTFVCAGDNGDVFHIPGYGKLGQLGRRVGDGPVPSSGNRFFSASFKTPASTERGVRTLQFDM